MTSSANTATTAGRLQIDFFFLDLETCARCLGTDESLESALGEVRDLLAATGTEVHVNKVQVESAEQARELRFVSSPTITVNGIDVELELRESSCGSEACTDGCGEAIACRVWVDGYREHTEPPAHADCCPPAEQRTCCDAEDKGDCCGAATGRSCGCR